PTRNPPSTPSPPFSSTVNGSTSMKCWCTIPIPALSASCADRNTTARPRTNISPRSARWHPYKIPTQGPHHRRLPRPVLPHPPMNESSPHHERHILIGMDRPKPLVDPPQLNHR